jgi:Xaa-Pro aminopeptidase
VTGAGPPPTIDEWLAELELRREAARALAGEHDAEALLVFGTDGHAEPFRYLVNFEPVLGSMWLLLPVSGDAFCALDFHWQLEEARRRSGITSWHGAPGPIAAVIDAVRDRKLRRIAMAGLDRVTAAELEQFRRACPDVDLIDVGGQLAEPRRRKSDIELRCLRAAARVTDEALDTVRAELRPGMTELEIAARLGYVLRRESGSWAFVPCVVSGNDDPIPIRAPGNRRVDVGDSVMIDIGGAWDGYQADVSRTWVLGEPNEAQAAAWDIVVRAHAAAISQVRPGVPCAEVSRPATELITGAGFELGHRIGHGIGLATSFEWPSLDHDSTPLEPGMTFCLEPAVYGVGFGNMKLEDDVVVTEDGCDLLSNASRELVVEIE